MPVSTRRSTSSGSSSATLGNKSSFCSVAINVPSEAVENERRHRRRKSARATANDHDDYYYTYGAVHETGTRPTVSRYAQAPAPTEFTHPEYRIPYSEPARCKHCGAARRDKPASSSSSTLQYLVHVPFVLLYLSGPSGQQTLQTIVMFIGMALMLWVIMGLWLQNSCLRISLCWLSCWNSAMLLILMMAFLGCAVSIAGR